MAVRAEALQIAGYDTDHGLWIAEPMVSGLSAEELIGVLEGEAVAEEIQISFKVRIQERVAGDRISVVPRRSGEYRREG